MLGLSIKIKIRLLTSHLIQLPKKIIRKNIIIITKQNLSVGALWSLEKQFLIKLVFLMKVFSYIVRIMRSVKE